MRKTLATIAALSAGLLGATVPASSASAATCTVKMSTVLGEASAKSTAIVYPLDNRRVHHFVFVYPTMPVQEMRKARGRTTAIAFEAPRYVIAFRNGVICKTGDMVGIG